MKFTEEHEWLRVEDDLVVVGITEHASEQLGDVVFVELPEEGTEVVKDDEVAVIESVKAASDILAPVDGEIVEVNSPLVENTSVMISPIMLSPSSGQCLARQLNGSLSCAKGRRSPA